MRIARLPFNRSFMYSSLKFTPDTFVEIMGHLPKGSFIVGFGNSSHDLVDYIFVQNDIFRDTLEGSPPPDIQVTFSGRPDGSAYCSSIDWSMALPKNQHMISAFNGNVSAQSAKRCSKDGSPCFYVLYAGQFKTEEICRKCGDPKP